jgi:uncharacterized RDD family membrane protein YckC
MESQNNLLNEFTETPFEYASAGQRFLNYIIDTIAFYILYLIILSFLGFFMMDTFSNGISESTELIIFLMTYGLAIFIMLAYYTLLEGSKGKTLGKLITKTKVVTETGEPITYKQTFIRTLIRFVPFEFLSGFSGLKMWHDQWTKTMVVKDK